MDSRMLSERGRGEDLETGSEGRRVRFEDEVKISRVDGVPLQRSVKAQG